MQAAERVLQVSATNTATAVVAGAPRQRVIAQARRDGGVETRVASEPPTAESVLAATGTDEPHEVVSQITAKRSFAANVAVFRAEDENARALVRRKV